MEPVAYTSRRVRIGISLLASFYIIFHGRPFEIGRAVTSPKFYLALAVSFAVTILLVKIVHYMTLWLDHHVPWRNMTKERIMFQVLLCFVLPLLIDFVILSVYFYLGGTTIFESGFISHDLPLIACFVLLINFYYITLFLYHTHYEDKGDDLLVRGSEVSRFADDTDENDLYNIDHNGLHVQIKASDDIIYFIRINRKVHAFAASGIIYHLNDSLKTIESQYNSLGFCKINRSTIVNCRTVKGYSTGVKRDAYMVVFKPEFNFTVSEEIQNYLYITRQLLPDYEDCMHKLEFLS